ncbi:MAG: FTR1 family protein [Mariprofundaceae bacterium]|nr:FTR1 family protein [Mariprofundaceae bacterium]
MISSWIIVFREVLEMALVLGVLLAATKGAQHSRRWIGFGAFIGFLGAVIVAFLMEEMESSVHGNGEFIFNAVLLSLAACLLAWTVLWMSQHGRDMTMRMQQIGSSVTAGDLPTTALFVVALSAVMREGSEAVFFLFGAAESGNSDAWNIVWGSLLGMLSGAGVGYILYRSLLHIPMQSLFRVLAWLLMFLAAGMASQAAANLTMIEVLPPLVEILWNTSSWLPVESIIGEVLHVMIGYDDQPNGMQVLVFAVFLMGMIVLNRQQKAS